MKKKVMALVLLALMVTGLVGCGSDNNASKSEEGKLKVGMVTDTGTIDGCFDDSLLVSKKCFNFMKIGKKYNCNIKLFGEAVLDMQNHTLFCKVMEHNVIIGATKMVKVLVENDEYYIEQEKLENFIKMDSFYFRYSRKDLIQVNNIIHSDLL